MATCSDSIEAILKFDLDTTAKRLRVRGANAVTSIFLMLLLAGCRVGPDAGRPVGPWLRDHYSAAASLLPISHTRSTDTESNFNTKSDSADVIPTSVDLACWWKAIDDPCLNQLISRVSHENLELRAAYFRIAEARYLAGAVEGRFFPTLDHKSSYAHRKKSINGTQFGNPLSQPFNFYSTGFDSTWEIDLFGKIQRSMESAQAKANATKEAYAALRLTLFAELATNYVNYRVIEARLRIAEQNEASQRSTLQLVSKRLKAGLAVPLDEAQAESNLYSTSATVPTSRQDLVKVRNRICVLLGEAPGDEMDLFLGEGPIPEFPTELSPGVPCDLLRRRPDIRQAEFTVASACADIGVATADLYPQLSLKGDISVDSRQYTNLFASDSLTFGIGPSLRWKLLYWGSIQQNIESCGAKTISLIQAYKASGGGWAPTPYPAPGSVTIINSAPQGFEADAEVNLQADSETSLQSVPSTETVDETQVLESPIR